MGFTMWTLIIISSLLLFAVNSASAGQEVGQSALKKMLQADGIQGENVSDNSMRSKLQANPGTDLTDLINDLTAYLNETRAEISDFKSSMEARISTIESKQIRCLAGIEEFRPKGFLIPDRKSIQYSTPFQQTPQTVLGLTTVGTTENLVDVKISGASTKTKLVLEGFNNEKASYVSRARWMSCGV